MSDRDGIVEQVFDELLVMVMTKKRPEVVANAIVSLCFTEAARVVRDFEFDDDVEWGSENAVIASRLTAIAKGDGDE